LPFDRIGAAGRGTATTSATRPRWSPRRGSSTRPPSLWGPPACPESLRTRREASVPLITGPTKWPLSPPRATGARAKELLIDAHGALARPSEPAFGPHSNAV